jgi:hypothetical protein
MWEGEKSMKLEDWWSDIEALAVCMAKGENGFYLGKRTRNQKMKMEKRRTTKNSRIPERRK